MPAPSPDELPCAVKLPPRLSIRGNRLLALLLQPGRHPHPCATPDHSNSGAPETQAAPPAPASSHSGASHEFVASAPASCLDSPFISWFNRTGPASIPNLPEVWLACLNERVQKLQRSLTFPSCDGKHSPTSQQSQRGQGLRDLNPTVGKREGLKQVCPGCLRRLEYSLFVRQLKSALALCSPHVQLLFGP